MLPTSKLKLDLKLSTKQNNREGKKYFKNSSNITFQFQYRIVLLTLFSNGLVNLPLNYSNKDEGPDSQLAHITIVSLI